MAAAGSAEQYDQARLEDLHLRLWAALDTLAWENGLSASGLAMKAGLDATSFNKSKRKSRDGRLRWPSTESVAKVLLVLDLTYSDFATLIEPAVDEGDQ